MNRLAKIAVLSLLCLGCGPVSGDACPEADIAAWDRATMDWATPIDCNGKTVGYQLDIDSTDGTSRTWLLANHNPTLVNGPVFVSADIDAQTSVDRVASISRGSAVYAESTGGASVTVKASATVISGPLLRMLRVVVPEGVRYRAQIRNLRW